MRDKVVVHQPRRGVWRDIRASSPSPAHIRGRERRAVLMRRPPSACGIALGHVLTTVLFFREALASMASTPTPDALGDAERSP